MTVQYTIQSINNGVAKVVYADGSWAEIVLSSDMTAEELDDLAYQYRPKTGSAPSFISEGQSRTAVEVVDSDPAYVDERPQWLIDRTDAYGTVESQIEYITENGLSAWQTHVAQIKADNPKPSDD